MPATRRPTTEENIRAGVGARVRRARRQAGLTQTQLGARSGREQGTISRIETGDHPTLTVGLLLDLAYALGCHPGDLLEWPPCVMEMVELDAQRAAREPEAVA